MNGSAPRGGASTKFRGPRRGVPHAWQHGTTWLALVCALGGCARSSSAGDGGAEADAAADAMADAAADALPDGREDSVTLPDASDCAPQGVTWNGDLHTEVDSDWLPEGPYYRIAYLQVERLTPLEEPLEGAPLRVLLETTLPDDCWQLTSLHTRSSPEHPRVRFVALRAWHLEQATCAGPPRPGQRIVTLPAPSAGCWSIIDMLGDARLVVRVPRCNPAARVCECGAVEDWPREGDACDAGCECARFGGVCAAGTCRTPCAEHADCIGASCGPAEWLCERPQVDECGTDDDCPAQHACIERVGSGLRVCFPAQDLGGATRHPCASNADCETPGLVCTLDTTSGADDHATCNLPCITRRSPCPGMHSCNIGDTPVCEWVGE